MYEYSATTKRVIDGDTVDFDIDLGLRVYTVARCRLYGINAPELSTEAGKLSRTWLGEKLPVGSRAIIRTLKDKTEKYGRWLAIITVGDECLNESAIEAGMAVRWDGMR